MAWELQFDGVNDRADFSVWTATGDFTVSGFVDTQTRTEIFIGDNSSSQNYVANLSNGNFRIKVGNVSVDIVGTTRGTNVPFSFNRVGSTVSYDVDGVTGSFTSAGTFLLDTLGTYNNNALPYNGRMYGIWTLSRVGDVRTYDMDASIHSSGTVIVTDTTSASNATGVNMPTDGSAWVWDSAGETPWALQFDGTNDSATHTGFSIGSGDDFSLRIKASALSTASHTRWIGGNTLSSSNPRVIYLANTGAVRLTFSGNVNYEWAISLDVTVLQEIEFRRSSGALDLYVAGVLQAGGFTGNTGEFLSSKVIGGNFTGVTQEGQLEYIQLDINATPVHDWNATASSHASGTPVLTDTIGSNDATGVNMPTDGSAWIDLGGGGGGLTLVVSSIASGESFGLPDVILNTAYLLPSAITTAESFGVPTVASLDQFIQAISVSSLEAFGEPLILTGGVTLAPTSITSQESLGTPFLVYSQLVLVDSITSEESFGIAIISDGVALVIPVGDRDTYQKIAEYLRATDKFVSYQNNEILLEWLRSEGIDEGSFNDSFKEYWNRKGYVGAYNDRWKSWKGE